jgi:uncharacterized protein
MRFERRAFLQKSLLWTAAAAIDVPVMAETARTSSELDLIARMTWMNPPVSWHRSGDKIQVHTGAKTDFWREPPADFRDTGHFLHLSVPGEFTFQASMIGQYHSQYDQAGLLLRVDAENWVKCCTEYFDGVRHASMVFTRGFSDWSAIPDLSQSAPIWWRVVRKKNWVEALCSADGKNFTSLRQGYFVAVSSTDVGIMCCAPQGPGFNASFEQLKLEI